jgi:hypothetical protein
MTAVSNGSMQDLGRELTLDELEAVSGGFRVDQSLLRTV